MMPSLDGGIKSFALGAAFAITLELATHVIVHYTVPGATFAANLAQGLAPMMDSLGLTTIFGDAAGESVTEEVVASVAGECTAGGFCPIHDPIVGEPLIEGTTENVSELAPPTLSPDLLELPVLK